MMQGNGEVKELPKGWNKVKLGEVVEFEYGKSLTKSLRNESGQFPVFGSSGIVGYHNEYLVEAPVLIVGRKGAVGEVWLSENNCWAIDTTYFVIVPEFLLTKFIFFLLKSLRLQQYDKSTTIPGLNRNDAYRLSVKLPPFAEQQRIVEKIEELFSDLDQGISSLKTAQKQLKVYRQVVLKWAFEGKLTEKWRSQIQQEKLDIQTGEELLGQIKAERENRYQQQLAEWKEAVREWEVIGRIGRKPTRVQKFKDFSSVTKAELTELAQLPAGWCWVNFGELVSEGPQNGLYKPASQYGDGVLIVRIDNFYDGKLNSWTTYKRLQVNVDELEIYRLENNDILINRVNSMTHLGKCAFVEKIGEDCVFESNVMKLKTFIDLISPKYITYYLSSVFGLKELRKNAKQAINQASINQADVCLSRVPLCSLEEQQQILQEIESRLSICDQLEATIIENLQKAEALRQSILKQAFEGKLVPQDPNDEPAEKLLERIKHEKLKVKKEEQLSIQGL